MTQRFPLGIQGRGQNPEKNDVIKSTDIFERDSLVPGQEPKLREDLTLTVEPNPAGTTQATQIQTTNTDDIMNHSVSLENHLWGTSLSLGAAIESLTKTTDEFEQLKFARGSHKSSLNEDFAFESIGDRIKAGIKKVTAFLRNLYRRIMHWLEGEKGRQARKHTEEARKACAEQWSEKYAGMSNKEFFDAWFKENAPDQNPFETANTAGSFKKTADEKSSDVAKSFDEILAGIGIIMKSHRSKTATSDTSFKEEIDKINRNSDKLDEALKDVYATAEDRNSKFVNEVSRQNVEKFYKQFRDWYAKSSTIITDDKGELLAVKPATIDDIAEFIETQDVEPEVGNAMAQALRAAAKMAKLQEDRLKAEMNTARAVLSIESKASKGSESVAKENLTEPGAVQDEEDGGVNTGEGASTPATVDSPNGEMPLQVVGDQGDISLNAPEYLEGEHEGQTEEETQAVIEARAEDLSVAAESLVAQTRVLNKLKSNRVISVGFVTESIQTLGENPFKDVRYYTQLPSRTNYDYSVEALGDKIKEGAKALKDKVVAFLKRVWDWLKGLFSKQKATVEEAVEKADAQTAELKEATVLLKDLGAKANKPVSDFPKVVKAAASSVVKEKVAKAGPKKDLPESSGGSGSIPGDEYTGPPIRAIDYIDQGTAAEVVERIRNAQRVMFSLSRMNVTISIAHRRFVELVKNRDLDKATNFVEVMLTRIADEDAGDKSRGAQDGYNNGLEKDLEKELTFQILFNVADHINVERREFLSLAADAAAKDKSVEVLADLTKLVEGLSEEEQGPYAGLISKFTKEYLRVSRKLNGEFASILYNMERVFPVGKLLVEINRIKKVPLDSEVFGIDMSNESLVKPMLNVETFGKRVPFWERSSKKANAGRSVAAFSMESYPAAPQWEDFSTESFGDIKARAKAMKDKFVAFLKRVTEWFKGLFASKEKKHQKAEEELNRYARYVEDKIRKAADANFPNIPTWEFLGLESAEMPSILCYRYSEVFKEGKKTDDFFVAIYKKYEAAVKAKDVQKAQELVQEYSDHVNSVVETVRALDTSTEKLAQRMIPLLKARVSFDSLDRLYGVIIAEHRTIMDLAQDARGTESYLTEVRNLMVREFDTVPNEIMTGLHQLVTLNTKVNQVVMQRALKFYAIVGNIFPYRQISSALEKAIAEAKVSTSNESYQEFYPEFSIESIGSKIKEGALALKDKLKKWISQFWNWLKGFFGNGKKKAEQIKAKVEQSAAQTETKFDEAKSAAPEQYEKPFEEVEELKPILEERAAPIKPAPAPSEAEKAAVPEHKLDMDRPAATIAELMGYAYAEYPARQAAYSDRISKIVIELNTWLAKQSGDFIKAVEKGDQRLADAISNTMREESKKLDKMRQDFRVESSQLNQELVKLMASKPSAHGLRRAAQILTEMRLKMISEAEAQLNSSNKALDLDAYEQVLDKLTPDNQAIFIELIQRVVNNIQKFVKFDNVELNRTLQSIERDFPVGRINSYAEQFMAKLKADLRDSIRKPQSGPANESLRTPFDDVDMESWTGFGLESDSFGEKVKQGAKELKDKLIALFKRVIEWLKNLFRRNKQNAEALKAKVDAAQEKVSEALESVKQSQPDVVDTPLSELEQTKALVENPPEPKPLTPEEKNGEKPARPETAKQVYQLFGHYMPASMGIYVLEYANCIEAYRSAYVSYAKVVADIGAAVKQDDVEKLHQIVDAYEAQVGKETEAFDSFRVAPEQTDAGLRRLMEKTPSVSVLEEVHLRVREVYDKLLVNGVDAVTKDTSDSSVAAMSRLISEFMGSNHDLELLGRVTRTFTKWQTKVRTRYEGYSVTASTQIPVYHTYQILQRFKTDTGGSVANESLRKLARRKPYWER